MSKCSCCGSHGLWLKTTSSGLCTLCAENKLNTISNELSALKASITPEMQNAIDLQKSIEELTDRSGRMKIDLAEATRKLHELNGQILVASETVEMESFALYCPRYAFAHSDEYKLKLEQIRNTQKQMLKAGTAAICSTEWTVNKSAEQGRKMTNEVIKLFLRAFNNECEFSVKDVKFSNFDSCKKRIDRSFEQINKLGKVNSVHITPEYLSLKHKELVLAYEYAQKKQEEKEEQAEIRRQQREQAKLDKEIAEARKAAEKERIHYEQALSTLDEQINTCEDAVRKAELIARRSEIRSGLDDVTAKLEDIDYRQTNQRAGYVYIISNIGAFGEGVYKIGMTRRLNPMERVDELGDASVPFTFDVHAMIFSADAPALEAALHRAFDDRRLNKINRRREYFRVSLDEIKEVVRMNHDKSVEFIDVPIAEQYRQSIRM